MIGVGSKMNQNIIKLQPATPFSVQANYIHISHYHHPPAVGSIRDTHLHHTTIKTTINHTIGNIVPFGGKILYTRIRFKRTRTYAGYFVPLINGIEQTDHKITYSNPTAGDELEATTEIEFNALDRLALRWKPESGTAPLSDDINFMSVYGFNMGESTP
jgi:hypothetical protein